MKTGFELQCCTLHLIVKWRLSKERYKLVVCVIQRKTKSHVIYKHKKKQKKKYFDKSVNFISDKKGLPKREKTKKNRDIKIKTDVRKDKRDRKSS